MNKQERVRFQEITGTKLDDGGYFHTISAFCDILNDVLLEKPDVHGNTPKNDTLREAMVQCLSKEAQAAIDGF